WSRSRWDRGCSGEVPGVEEMEAGEPRLFPLSAKWSIDVLSAVTLEKEQRRSQQLPAAPLFCLI
ncbi:MAG TPA: hypothetical protein VGF67_22290, partial [Ktedonobacteraceae bacterium]